jgi:hypothetical protein
MNRIILDTNAYSRLLAGDEDVFVLGELHAGFLGGHQGEEKP